MISWSCQDASGRLRSAAARWWKNDRATSAIEFALLAPIVIGLIFATIMVGVVFFAKSELDIATTRTARAVMTGNVKTAALLTSSLCANTSGIFNCNGLMVNLQSYASGSTSLGTIQTASPTLTYNANGTVSNTWTQSFGSSGSIMVMQVMYQYPSIVGPLFNLATQTNGSNLMVSTAVFVND